LDLEILYEHQIQHKQKNYFHFYHRGLANYDLFISQNVGYGCTKIDANNVCCTGLETVKKYREQAE
jgi:hypothetical protein